MDRSMADERAGLAGKLEQEASCLHESFTCATNVLREQWDHAQRLEQLITRKVDRIHGMEPNKDLDKSAIKEIEKRNEEPGFFEIFHRLQTQLCQSLKSIEAQISRL